MRLSRISLGSQAFLPLLVSLEIRVQDRTTQVYLRARQHQTLVLANDEVKIRQLLKDTRTEYVHMCFWCHGRNIFALVSI